jgi:hypothetical protein
MTQGLLDPALIAFVLMPLVVGAALLFALALRRASSRKAARPDAVTSTLAWIVGAMPRDRAEWGAAMLAELAAVSGTLARWRFAFGCARVALFPPRNEAGATTAERNPTLGLLAVALPLLALPLLYGTAAMLEAVSGSPYTSSDALEPQLATAIVKLLLASTVGCLVAGVPLGLAGRWRGERMACLTAWGVATSGGMFAYFLIGMHLIAGDE